MLDCQEKIAGAVKAARIWCRLSKGRDFEAEARSLIARD